MAVDQPMFPTYGRAPQPGKPDPRLSPLKSAVQKYIRRGMLPQAVATAAAMIEIPGGTASLARRLPVIGAEDVGYWTLPWVVEPQMTGAPHPAVLLDITAGLAIAPKSKSAYWLADCVWFDRHKPGEVSIPALRAAIEEEDYLEAVAIMLAADEAGTLHGKGGISVVLHQVSDDLPDVARRIVKAGLWRNARGGAGEIMASMAIAAIDKPTEFAGPWEIPGYEIGPRPTPLDAYCLDGHTAIGSRALSIVVKRHSLKSRDWLFDLQFDFESIRLGPSTHPDNERWRSAAMQFDADHDGWVDEDRGRQIWEDLYRDEVLGLTDWIQRQELAKGGFA